MYDIEMNAIMTTIIRHQIDPAIIANSIAWRIAEFERFSKEALTNKPPIAPQNASKAECAAILEQHAKTCKFSKDYYVRVIRYEQDHYSRPRVIETQRDSENSQFRLVYGADQDAPDVGTGPFTTLEAAIRWYANNGR